MNDLVTHPLPETEVSESFALDQTIEDLIGKIVAGTVTDTDLAQYHNMLARRSRSMRPNYRAFRVAFGR